MADTDTTDSDARISPLIPMTTRELVSTTIAGAVAGASIAVLYLLMHHFVFQAVLCRAQAMSGCSEAPSYAMTVAMIIGAIVGVGILSKLRIYRPLLIVVAVAISLWGMSAIVAGFQWYWLLLSFAVLFGLAYALFAWVARIRSFILALVVTTVLIVVMRLVLTA